MEDYAGEEGYDFEDEDYHDDDLDMCQDVDNEVPKINAKGSSVEVLTSFVTFLCIGVHYLL